MSNPRTWVDFHNADQYGNVRLNCVGTQKDLQEQKIELSNGFQLTLYDEELEIEGVVVYSEIENDWVAQIDWSLLMYKNLGKEKSLFERIKDALSGNN
jgi:hypothetical protein